MRRLAALIVPLALSACATYGYPGGGRHDGDSGRGRWDDYGEYPLNAEIVQSGGGYAVRLNRPAYIAVFEIVPGQGVGLMYPAYTREASYLPSGFSYLNTRGPRYYDWYHRSSGLASRTYGQPRFYFLVASRRPLSVGRFQRSPGALRTVLGLNAYGALNHRTVMADLVSAVVPYQHDDDWTTDVLAVWPDRRYDRYAYDDDRYIRVRCPDGRVIITPWELYSYACGARRGTGNGGGTVVPPPRPREPGDSTGIDKPGRRRPEPGNTGAETADGRIVAPGRRPGNPEAVDRPRLRPNGGEQGGESEEPRVSPERLRPRGGEPRPENPKIREEGEDAPRIRTEPRREEPRVRDETRTRETPRREEPRREPPPQRNDPPARAEPRRDPPPAPRNDPPARSEPRSEPARERPAVDRPARVREP